MGRAVANSADAAGDAEEEEMEIVEPRRQVRARELRAGVSTRRRLFERTTSTSTATASKSNNFEMGEARPRPVVTGTSGWG